SDLVTAVNLAFVLHYLLAGLCMYLLLRLLDFSWVGSVVAGTAYQLVGVVASYASPGHDGKLFVTALLPVMLIGLVLGVRRRRWEGFALLGLAVGLALLSPQYQATQYSLIAAGIFTLYLAFGEPHGLTVSQRWTGLALAAAAVVVGFALSMVQVLPFTHYVPYSPRAQAAGFEWSSSYGIPWIHVPELFLSGFAGAKETYYGPNTLKLHSEYLGLPVIALALFGLGSPRRRLVKWIAGIAVLFLLIALGGATPFYRLWYAIVPYVNKTRAPGMASFVVALATAVLAACGRRRLAARAFSLTRIVIVGGALWRAAPGSWRWSRPEQAEYAAVPIVARLKGVPLPCRVLVPGVCRSATLMRHDIPQLLGYH